ncbi:MAG: hypothetical protein KA288_09355 [Paludibacteraceae bacterium]|jgi:hypothetical protein|nr:hypothetical protein [Paludibacteraceae bacterium]
MLGSKISNSIYQKDNTINISLTDKDYRDSDKSIFEYSNYSKKLLSNASQNSNYSNTLILTDSYYITQKNKQTLEKRFSNDFEIFKEKFENFLRFEDVPIEYVSPIEREFIKFLKIEKVQTLNLVGQWIIDSFDDSKTLLNIVKILGNVANEFLDGQLLTNLFILLNHRDTEIKEYVLRIQEKVMSDVFHNLLSHSHLAPQWIDEYRSELVEMYNEENDLEE